MSLKRYDTELCAMATEDLLLLLLKRNTQKKEHKPRGLATVLPSSYDDNKNDYDPASVCVSLRLLTS